MQLSVENLRQRRVIMGVVWLFAIGLAFSHALVVRSYLSMVGELGLRGAAVPATPLQMAYPTFAADAQTWVRHALALLEGDDVRLRYTYIDNAPDGREVHWNSAWAWIIAGAGKLDQWTTGALLPQAVERATLWLNPLVLSSLIIVMSSWVARRAGAIAGVIVVAAMIGHARLYEGFYPSYVDHHGLHTVAVLGLTIGATVMGAGWWQQRPDGSLGLLPASLESVRRGAVFSALSGACGMWVNAASAIPSIAIVGLAAIAAIILQGRQAQQAGANFDPGAWRIWGRVGGMVSLLFYLVEYFPSHLGLRLEANHPFYALAWLGGGELVAQAGERWLGPREQRWAGLTRLLAPLLAVAIAPLTIAVGGASVFAPLDPFLAELHRTYIQEFLPYWSTIRDRGWLALFSVDGLENIPLIVAVVLLSVRRGACPIVLWFATLTTVAITAMGWMQLRWLLNAAGAQVALTMVLVVYFTTNARPSARWATAIATVSVLFLPDAFIRIASASDDVHARHIAPRDATQALFRDMAAALRATQPTGDIVLLASPYSSTGIGYYGRFKTLGTLYWENTDGLKAAAAILCARTPAEAALLIRQHHVTHFAMVSEENFIEPYYRLLHPGATAEDIKKCFGYQLLVERVIPPWLEIIPYKEPDDLSALNVNAALFKVAFDQTPAEALYHIALEEIAVGAVRDAERDIDTLIRLYPRAYQPWLRKGELLFDRHEWAAAADALLGGITRAPPAEHPELFANTAGNFFRAGQPAQVIRFYRAALAEYFDPQIAAYLAFILATTPDATLRDGKDAQALAERALQADPTSPTFLNSEAAALAENGRYPEAVAVATRALANARLRLDADAQYVTEMRLAIYRLGKPLRQ